MEITLKPANKFFVRSLTRTFVTFIAVSFCVVGMLGDSVASDLGGEIILAKKSGAEGNGAEGNGPKKPGGAEGNGLENSGAEGNGPARPRRNSNQATAKLDPNNGVFASNKEIIEAQKSKTDLVALIEGKESLLVKKHDSEGVHYDVYFIKPDLKSLSKTGDGAHEKTLLHGEVFYARLNMKKIPTTGQVKMLHAGRALLSLDEVRGLWQVAI